MEITSTAFVNNAVIPTKYTCDGLNISPALSWKNVPQATQSLVLIMDDPDAPRGTWVHWILYNLPTETFSLEDNIQNLPKGASIGINTWGKKNYGGPCPPSGRHRYFFKLYALDKVLNFAQEEKVNSEFLDKVMRGHVLAETFLIGIYR